VGVRQAQRHDLTEAPKARAGSRNPARRLQWSALVAIGLVGAAALVVNLNLIGGKAAAQPQPVLYSYGALRAVRPDLASASKEAVSKTDAWLRQYPQATPGDFEAWAIGQVGPPPGTKVQRSELAELTRIAKTRTPAGDSAAKWLEKNGKKKVWKIYAKQYATFASKAQAKHAKRTVKQTLTLAKDLSAKTQSRYPRTAPYEVDTALSSRSASVDQSAALAQLRSNGVRRVSYPSKHALISAAASAVLSSFQPQRAAEFAWMSQQVDYSRLYAAGHYPSDVRAGALLGYMLAEYELDSPIGAAP
jgi:hypothetical protein